jgi:ribonuclease HII
LKHSRKNGNAPAKKKFNLTKAVVEIKKESKNTAVSATSIVAGQTKKTFLYFL